MKKIIWTIVITFLLVGCSSGVSFVSINGDDALKLAENETTIIDVRSLEEYESGHIKGAINIPVDTIKLEKLEQVIPSKDNNIIVYCRSGNRSRQAAQILIDLGYTNIYDLGGISNWSGELE